ncbi:hypothetical protein KUTeg_001944 [Tegillarca granosa]|uniref:Uncharacterized protein n=1 Tax=Tegillarca granosa TaxID=220873 RepID=A0ABQ9FUC8_TEGGR|nr:hypothetical protein KUTeg_001944 [Tegillarca granosa]
MTKERVFTLEIDQGFLNFNLQVLSVKAWVCAKVVCLTKNKSCNIKHKKQKYTIEQMMYPILQAMDTHEGRFKN